MYAMIRRYRMGSGSIDDLMAKVDTQFADQLQSKLGIVGYQAVALDDDTILTHTLFATEEDMERAAADAEAVRRNLAEFEVDAVDALSGEVMVSRGSTSLLEPVHPNV